MLIAGRVLQGIGAAGITVLVEMIVCDIVPLRERGTYLGVVMGLSFLGSALGPLFGGLIVENTSWRWVFYLNLPVGEAALVALFFFLQVKFNKEMTIPQKLKRMDFVGAGIFVGSAISVLIALAWAGSLYAWSSVQVILPLVLGFIGLGCFLIYEAYAADPIMPLRLFQNRTSLVTFILTFVHGIATIWPLYFLPVYFQAVLQASTEDSGIDLLPTILAIVPFAILAGVVMGKIGRYKPIHLVGFAIMIVGFGLFTLLDEDSSTAAWVLFQVVESMGAGLVIPTLLPAVMAELTDADTGSATGTWSFMRGFGVTWGVAIPSAIFNDQTTKLASRIQDPSVVAMLTGGQAYEHATRSFVESLTDPTVKAQVISVFSESLKRLWQIGIVFPVLGFLIVFLEKEVPLRQELDTEYGMETGKA
jgi:MFS family permease